MLIIVDPKIENHIFCDAKIQESPKQIMLVSTSMIIRNNVL